MISGATLVRTAQMLSIAGKVNGPRVSPGSGGASTGITQNRKGTMAFLQVLVYITYQTLW